MAFRYALSIPNVALNVIGMSTREELRQNVARARGFTPLTREERAALAPIGRKLARQWGPHFGPTA
jgi:predicted aldo/keto reductase-like oxidoreductase